MRRHGRVFPARNMLLRRAVIAVTILTSACSANGCARTAPVRLEPGDLVSNPRTHRNKRVELAGHVLDYEAPRGDAYRTFSFTVGLRPDEKIEVVCSGYTAGAIEKAARLVGEAFEAREAITVVGKVKIDSRAGAIPAYELKLESVHYKGQEIVITRGHKTRPGFEVGGWHVTPSIGIQATITP